MDAGINRIIRQYREEDPTIQFVTQSYPDYISCMINNGDNVMWTPKSISSIRWDNLSDDVRNLIDRLIPTCCITIDLSTHPEVIEYIKTKNVTLMLRSHSPKNIQQCENYIANSEIPVKASIDYSLLISYLEWKQIPYIIDQVEGQSPIGDWIIDDIPLMSEEAIGKILSRAIITANEKILLAIMETNYDPSGISGTLIANTNTSNLGSLMLILNYSEYFGVDVRDVLDKIIRTNVNVNYYYHQISHQLNSLSKGDIIGLYRTNIIALMRMDNPSSITLDDVIEHMYPTKINADNIHLAYLLAKQGDDCDSKWIGFLIDHIEQLLPIIIELYKRDKIDLSNYQDHPIIQQLNENRVTKLKSARIR